MQVGLSKNLALSQPEYNPHGQEICPNKSPACTRTENEAPSLEISGDSRQGLLPLAARASEVSYFN